MLRPRACLRPRQCSSPAVLCTRSPLPCPTTSRSTGQAPLASLPCSPRRAFAAAALSSRVVAALSSRDVAAPPLIAVVAAALMRDGLVLCTQRSTSKSQPGRWEFPGGKVEPGEGIRDALARELVEELGVSVAPGDFAPIAFAVASQRSTGAGKDIVLLLFGATRFEGEPAIKEQQLALRWLSPEQLGADEFPMPSLDEPLLPVVRATLIGTCGEAASAAPPPSPVQRVFVSRRLAAIAAALVAG